MTDRSPSVAIVGGGLAGMAAAVAAVERGVCVELFEAAPRLGGRAGSMLDTTTGQRIDYCQHVAMGCCRSFLDFCRRTGIDDCFDRSTILHFIAPDAAQHDFTPSRWLPAPLHLLPGLMNLKYLTLGERCGIVRALITLMRQKEQRTTHANALTGGERTVGAWLKRHRQSERAIDQFWSVVLVSALGETVDHASLPAARQVFREGFLGSRDASDLLLPRWPLGDILHDRVGKRLIDRGVKVHLATPVHHIDVWPNHPPVLILADGTRRVFDFAIVAVPWRNVRDMFANAALAAFPALAGVEQIEPAAITAVHLWFDRPVTALAHAVLVGRRSQWAFTRLDGAGQQHVQVVISASHRLPRLGHDELLGEVRRELEAIWPTARDARLLHGRVIAQPTAIFSMTPEVERFRPPQQTPIATLALAGDWTATGWPATMEGAVRSGLSAVKALAS